MKITRFPSVVAVGAIAAIAMAGCAANESGGSASGAESADGGSLSGELVAGGASSQEQAAQAWTAGVQEANPDLTVTYDPTGSGGGRDNFQAGAFTVIGTDRAFTTDEIAAGGFKGCAEGSGIVELPAYVSPIALIFNVEGVDELDLDAKTIAGIFSGAITKWNDPAIAALNDGAKLPDQNIVPVHRADDSGTTENFTAYLAEAAPEAWTYEADGVWPINGGEAAQGTSGVAAAVEGGVGTIGYVDASRAGDFTTATVNGTEFSPETASAIVDASPMEEGRSDGDLAIALDRTTTEEGSYPIVLISYLVACEEYADPELGALAKGFLEYAISEDGQKAAAEVAFNAPISDELRDKAQKAVDLIAAE